MLSFRSMSSSGVQLFWGSSILSSIDGELHDCNRPSDIHQYSTQFIFSNNSGLISIWALHDYWCESGCLAQFFHSDIMMYAHFSTGLGTSLPN